jgi:hypothetical protein
VILAVRIFNSFCSRTPGGTLFERCEGCLHMTSGRGESLAKDLSAAHV